MRRILACASIILLLITLFMPVGAAAAELNVLASVEPHRIIVVNKKGHVSMIISNTSKAVRPIVVQEEGRGQEAQVTNTILDEYRIVLRKHDFSKPIAVRVKVYQLASLRFVRASMYDIEKAEKQSLLFSYK